MSSQILRQFQKHKSLTAPQLAKKLKITPQAIHKHLKRLIQEGLILKQGTSRKTTFYVLNRPAVLKKIWGTKKSFNKRHKTAGLVEETVYSEISRQPYLLSPVSPNTLHLFHYAFTEMLNNAIDHSRSRFVDLLVETNPQTISFSVTDHGVGIYENIRAKKGLADEMEALQDLLKGKQTTFPEQHSGEGIFFTSKVSDRFVIESHRKKLIIDNRLNDIFVSDIRYRKGTRVTVEIDNRSKRNLEETFKKYTNEEFQFAKSQVTVKLFKGGEEYVSRSQAKRLVHALDRFQEIILDFKDVETVGQGFADEIFRVFQSQHPEIKIVPINCHENVQFMINRAKSV
jgi:anti-sigma regulatory factor (Ser/Thr protein kinase)/biotin operon repressor